jgi:adenosylcobyric acid synthase
MGLARAANLPVILVGDIDRGGLLAHLYGTVAVLEPDDQRLISGFVVNKFRGDPALLAPGLDQLRELTGRPTYGVIPYTDGLWLDTEDSVSVLAHRVVGDPQPPRGPQWLRVAAIRLPRISNSTDVEALACEPGVLVRWVTDPADLADADVVVIPGSKATVPDLAWLRERGLADGITAHARQGKPMLGICGGFQMLCRRIDDPVESMAGLVDGLGLLDADIAFAPEKTVRATGAALAATSATGAALAATSATGAALAATSEQATPLHGYEIHHGQVARSAEDDWLGVGIRRGHVYGTHWHGLLDNDELRRRWLTDAAAAVGRSGFVVADDVDVAGRRDAQLDLMADLLTAHLDIDAVVGLLEHGPPKRPTLATALA